MVVEKRQNYLVKYPMLTPQKQRKYSVIIPQTMIKPDFFSNSKITVKTHFLSNVQSAKWVRKEIMLESQKAARSEKRPPTFRRAAWGSPCQGRTF